MEIMYIKSSIQHNEIQAQFISQKSNQLINNSNSKEFAKHRHRNSKMSLKINR